MVRVHFSKNGNKKYGDRPYLYAENPTRTLNNEAFLNIYDLISPDSWETGEAYSLHLTKKNAENYNPYRWWARRKTAEPVFISKKTLEKIVATKGKNTFQTGDT